MEPPCSTAPAGRSATPPGTPGGRATPWSRWRASIRWVFRWTGSASGTHLFRDLLREELRRHEPELIQQLQARAAAWCEINGCQSWPDPPRARTRPPCAHRDVAGARILLREVRYILQQRPRLGILPTQADQPQSKLDSLRETTPSATTLTPLSCDSCTALDPPHLPGDQRATLPLAAHGQVPGDLGLPQTRRLIPEPGDPAHAAGRPARSVGGGRRPGRQLIQADTPGLTRHTDHDATLPAGHPQGRHPYRPNRPRGWWDALILGDMEPAGRLVHHSGCGCNTYRSAAASGWPRPATFTSVAART